MNRVAPERLLVEGASVSFNGVSALRDVSLDLARGQILGLVGGNGAGKTTLINVISGFVDASAGSVRLGSHDLTRLPSHKRARLGIARTFQGVRPFGGLTVVENIEVPARASGLSWRSAHELAVELLDSATLDSPLDARADTLSYGQLRKLAVARALASRPSFVLLDEPAAGLNETETDEIGRALLDVRDRFGCGIVLVEHDLPLVTRVSDVVQVMAQSTTVAVGPPDEVFDRPEVQSRYFGVIA